MEMNEYEFGNLGIRSPPLSEDFLSLVKAIET
jgi:hypothetical protein